MTKLGYLLIDHFIDFSPLTQQNCSLKSKGHNPIRDFINQDVLHEMETGIEDLDYETMTQATQTCFVV